MHLKDKIKYIALKKKIQKSHSKATINHKVLILFSIVFHIMCKMHTFFTLTILYEVTGLILTFQEKVKFNKD